MKYFFLVKIVVLAMLVYDYRRRDRPLPGDDSQGQAVPADATARARLLPVAPAPRDSRSGLAAAARRTELRTRESVVSRALRAESSLASRSSYLNALLQFAR